MTREAKARLYQRLIAVPYLTLGAWCLLHPGSVEQLTLRPEYRHASATTALLFGCFGAQAILCGLFVVFSRFTRRTFLAYGLALLPFFAFNYYFVFVLPVFTLWMSLDFGANLAMLGFCVAGWRAASD
jgi:hypothetical protein